MNAGMREELERPYTDEDVIQDLEKYLRQEASSDVLDNDKMKDALKKRLFLKARDYAYNRGAEMADADASRLSQEALSRYERNWNGKVQGEDDRGHRLGISW